MSVAIHPTAVIHPGAKLGVDVSVGPYAVVEDRVEIGDRCVLEAHAVVRAFTRMGEGNRVFHMACVGGEPQDLKFHGEESWLEIGNHNVFREFCTIHRGTENGGGITAIGSRGLYMAYVHVAHDCRLGDAVIMSNGASLAGHVRVGNHVIIGAMSGVHQFAHIGDFAFVGGMSGVAQDLPPYCLATGQRATLRGLNLVGLARAGFAKEAVVALKRLYKLLFRSGQERQAALAQAEAEFADFPECRAVIAFVRSSERGVMSADRTENGED